MQAHQDQTFTLKFTFYASVSLVILTAITFALAMLAVPPSGPYCPGGCMNYPYPDILKYYPRDYYWMYSAIFQLFTFIVFMVSNHITAATGKKLFSLMNVTFALLSAVVLLIAYFVQFSVVPVSVMKGESDGIAILTQYNGHGIFIAMEELGYIAMSISFLFLAFVFSAKNRLEKSLRWLLLLPSIIIVISFIFYSLKYGLDRDYRFEVTAITVNWLVTIAAGILISIIVKKRIKNEISRP